MAIRGTLSVADAITDMRAEAEPCPELAPLITPHHLITPHDLITPNPLCEAEGKHATERQTDVPRVHKGILANARRL